MKKASPISGAVLRLRNILKQISNEFLLLRDRKYISWLYYYDNFFTFRMYIIFYNITIFPKTADSILKSD